MPDYLVNIWSCGSRSIEGGRRSTPGQHDVLLASTIGSTHSLVFAITSEGRAFSVKSSELGEIKGEVEAQLPPKFLD